MSVQFDPESWDVAAHEIMADGEAFAGRATRALEQMTTARLNCEGFGTMMDAAFAVIFPAAANSFHETAAGLGNGFTLLGDAMGAVAASYRATEADNEAIAGEAGF